MQKVVWCCFSIILLVSCNYFTKNKEEATITNNDYNTNGINPNYDWTGTYELKKDTLLYTLKLHKRSVDGNYEMQLFSNDKYIDLYKSSIYDAKDDSANIYIKYLNNFNMDIRPLGFKSGDTLFILHLNEDKTEKTILRTFLPKDQNLQFNKISRTYN
ncbi:MAG: hypothetical protein U0U67_04250 [Chitinophagales bacterium]